MGDAFPERLRRLVKKADRKRYAMAHCFGLDRKTLSRYENGESEPNMTNLIYIADYFNVSIDYLVGRTDNPEMNK